MNGRRAVAMALVMLLVGVSLLGLPGLARAERRSRAVAPAGLSVREWQDIVDQIRERPYRGDGDQADSSATALLPLHPKSR